MTTVPDAAGLASADRGAPGWAERLSDSMNPILVREVLQATSGRVFMFTLGLAVAALTVIGLTAVAIPSMQGRDTLMAALGCLAPIVIFILPLQAFASMRQEVSGGTAEQLLLTRLSPLRIVAGKLLASMAMFVLFLGMFSPLIALTYLLRGIDVVTIAIVLAFSLLASLVANAFAIAMASLGRVRWLAPISLIVTIAGLGAGTMGAMGGAVGGVIEIQRGLSDPDFLGGCVGAAIAGLLATSVFAAIAQAVLAHEHENRSTPFRVIALVMPTLAVLWCVAFLRPSDYDDAGPGMATALAVYLTPFLIGAAAERESLSPRVARYVPASPFRAWLVAPLLPGGGRGVLFSLCIALFLLAVAAGLPALGGSSPDRDLIRVAITMLSYVVILVVLARRIRAGSFGRRTGFWGSSILTLVAIVLGMLASLATMAAGHGDSWSAVQVVNIPWTVIESHESGSIVVLVGVLGVLVMMLGLPAARRGIHEVLAASARRREIDAS